MLGRTLVLILALMACGMSCYTTPQRCRGDGTLRKTDKHVGSHPELVVISLDTTPSPASEMFEATLQHFGYEYHLLGSTKSDPQPPSNGVFKLAIWHYRFLRYRALVEKIAQETPNKIILLSDANDVLIAAPPEEVVEKFKALNQRILLTGHMSCCNVRLYEYVKDKALSMHFSEDDLFSTDPSIKSYIAPLQYLLAVEGRVHGFSDGPTYLWTPAAQREMALIKAIPMQPEGPASKYRYLNAGGILGYAEDLLAAMNEIDMQPFDDDEERWTLWYAQKNGGYHTNRALIDYQREIFALVDDYASEKDKLRVLFDDLPELPTGRFFNFTFDEDKQRWKTEFGTYPAIFHCAGCNIAPDKMRTFHERILAPLTPETFMNPDLLAHVGAC